MESSVEVFETKLYCGAVADEIIASVQEVLSDNGACSLVLAGGSTPGAIYRTISKPPRATEVPWEKVKLYIGDERWVPRDDNQSNAKMVYETLLSQLQPPGPRFYAVDTSLAVPDKGAEAYAAVIRDAERISSSGEPAFDIVLLGVGEDGHTASLFPGSPMIGPPGHTAGKIACAVPHPQGGHRVSLTSEALFNARMVFFIVKGQSKASILKRVIEGNEDYTALPSKLYTRATGKVTWLLDTEASQELTLNRS